MSDTVDQHCLDTLMLKARTQNGWLDRPVTDEQLRRIYDIMKQGPTSANSCPARVLFLRTQEAKARLLPALSPGNVDKTKAAPVTAIIGYDTCFFELMPTKLFAHRPEMADNYAKNPAFAEITAFRNGTLQAPTSCWPRAPSASTLAGCRASTMRRSTRSSFPTGA